MSFRTLVLTVLLITIPAMAQAQSKATPVEGVWKVAEVQVIGGQTPATNTTPQPGFYIFTKGHYSIVTVNSDKPRTVIPQRQSQAPLTDAEKIALYEQWGPFTANAGTYSVKGSTITTKALVAKNQGVMEGTGPGATREFKLEGNTLWLIQKPASGQTGAETRTKLTRVE